MNGKRTGLSAAGLALVLSLCACSFEPEINLARYHSCEPDGSCAVVGCECLEKWKVCRPLDPAGVPEDCFPVAPDCEQDSECDDDNPCTDDACVEGVCEFINDDTNECAGDDPDALYVCNSGDCVEIQPPDCVSDDDCGISTNCVIHSCESGRCLETFLDGTWEGPYGHASCTNGLDDDCDGFADEADPACRPHIGACSPDGWCWENPLPTGNRINDLFHDGQHLWAVGEAGTVLRWDGQRWEDLAPGVWGNNMALDVNAVWACESAVWIFGDAGFIARRDEGSENWQRFASFEIDEDLLDAWGRSCTEVWAVGRNGTLLRLEGQNSWGSVMITSDSSATLRGIWGGASSIWVVGDGGALLFSEEGNSFSSHSVDLPPGVATDLHSVWGTAGGVVWIVGAAETIFMRVENQDWVQVGTASEDRAVIRAVHCDGAGKCYAAGDSGEIWLLMQTGSPQLITSTAGSAPLHALWVAGSEQIYAGGALGAMGFFDGQEWRSLSSGRRAALYGIHGQDGSLGFRPWAVGASGTILRRAESSHVWEESGSMVFAGADLRGVCCLGAEGTWVVGTNGFVFRRDDLQAWTQAAYLPGGTLLYDIHGLDVESLVVVGSGPSLWSWQSGEFLSHFAEGHEDALRSVHLFSATGGYAVGDQGRVYSGNYNDGEVHWLAMPTVGIDDDFADVWSPQPGYAWIVGEAFSGGPSVRRIVAGEFLSYNDFLPATGQALSAVWSRGGVEQGIWIAGTPGEWDEQAYVGMWNGQLWQPTSTGCKRGLKALWGDGWTLYVVGEGGAILGKLLGPD